jgi:hypothetical protein
MKVQMYYSKGCIDGYIASFMFSFTVYIPYQYNIKCSILFLFWDSIYFLSKLKGDRNITRKHSKSLKNSIM